MTEPKNLVNHFNLQNVVVGDTVKKIKKKTQGIFFEQLKTITIQSDIYLLWQK